MFSTKSGEWRRDETRRDETADRRRSLGELPASPHFVSIDYNLPSHTFPTCIPFTLDQSDTLQCAQPRLAAFAGCNLWRPINNNKQQSLLSPSQHSDQQRRTSTAPKSHYLIDWVPLTSPLPRTYTTPIPTFPYDRKPPPLNRSERIDTREPVSSAKSDDTPKQETAELRRNDPERLSTKSALVPVF